MPLYTLKEAIPEIEVTAGLGLAAATPEEFVDKVILLAIERLRAQGWKGKLKAAGLKALGRDRFMAAAAKAWNDRQEKAASELYRKGYDPAARQAMARTFCRPAGAKDFLRQAINLGIIEEGK